MHIWSEIKGDRLRLWVEDNGIGIEPPHQDRIFSVFEWLHGSEAYPGTGIGLAIVKKGVERLGGRFGVESSLDRGSRLLFLQTLVITHYSITHLRSPDPLTKK